ncbi:hypothetical protein C8R45DRAFT_1100547 [Mycena sanguinolenta]|nr:hypothetical protein C8R45DRAFT_1100547 [Mycena sanguinolenta]
MVTPSLWPTTARDPPHGLEGANPTHAHTLDTTLARTQARPAPPAACDTGVPSPCRLEKRSAITDQHLCLPYSPAPPSPPPACAAHTMVVPHPRGCSCRLLEHQACLALGISSTWHPRAQHLWQSLPFACAEVITSPLATTVSSASFSFARSQLLAATRSTMCCTTQQAEGTASVSAQSLFWVLLMRATEARRGPTNKSGV